MQPSKSTRVAAETRPRTAEQIEAHRAANRVVNMTPQAIVMQNERAARRREQLHPDYVPPLAVDPDVVHPHAEPLDDAMEDQALWPLPEDEPQPMDDDPIPGIQYRGRCRIEDFVEDDVPTHDCGRMDVPCQFGCGALLWPNESPTTCCNKGTVLLGELPAVPDVLDDLFTDQTQRGRDFRTHVRAYNTNLAFTSTGATINDDIEPGGVFTYRLHSANFAQMYIYDGEQAAMRRSDVMRNLDRGVLLDLHDMMVQVSPYVHQLRQLYGLHIENPPVELELRLTNVEGDDRVDRRQFNLPTVQEVAAIVPGGNDGEDTDYRDIVLTTRDHGPRRIKTLHTSYEPLTYPVLFPHGSNGWTYTRKQTDGTTKMTLLQYVSARIAYRVRADGRISIVHMAGRLMHQYVVDLFHRIEADRARFIKNHQDLVRAGNYREVAEHVEQGDAAEDTGRGIILPPTFVGGRRYYDEKYRDTMASVAKNGPPDIFATMTCNPNSRDHSRAEITRELQPGQQSSDRPELISRVFALKLAAFLDDVTKKMLLGVVIANVHVIEFQKRGLPHAHILIFFRNDCKIRTPAEIASLICAEIPDPDTLPRLHAIVKHSMVHGPCGVAYPHLRPTKCGTVNDPNKCNRHYPKDFAEETTRGNRSAPLYRRRNNGRTVTVGQGRTLAEGVDNRYIVPFNPFMSVKYNCHINVEVTQGTNTVKYIFKYVYKGQPLITAELRRAADQPQPPVAVDVELNAEEVPHQPPPQQEPIAVEAVPEQVPQPQPPQQQPIDVDALPEQVQQPPIQTIRPLRSPRR